MVDQFLLYIPSHTPSYSFFPLSSLPFSPTHPFSFLSFPLPNSSLTSTLTPHDPSFHFHTPTPTWVTLVLIFVPKSMDLSILLESMRFLVAYVELGNGSNISIWSLGSISGILDRLPWLCFRGRYLERSESDMATWSFWLESAGLREE